MNEFFKKPNIDYNLQLREKYDITAIACVSITIGEKPEENLLLFLLFQSIASVTNDYLHYYINELENKCDNDKTDSVPLLERTFAYELYRQWFNYIKAFGITLRVDAEIGKKITNGKIDFQKIKKLEGDYKEPDLVLHAYQGNTENQTIICEIKRSEQLDETKIVNDIIKTCHFIDPQIWDGNPYKYGCFIVIHKTVEELSSMILNAKSRIEKEIKEKTLTPDMSHLLIITYNGDSVKWDLLSNLL